MNEYERIKSLDIEEMATFLVDLQLNVIAETKQKLVFCLPLPTEQQIERMLKDTLEALKNEAKREEK